MGSVIKLSSRVSKDLNQPQEIKPIDLILMDMAVGGFDRYGNPSADDPITQAKVEADIIIRTARSESTSLSDQAYAEGFEQGIADAAKQAEELIARLEHDIAEIALDRARVVDTIEPQALKLCMEAVEKVIRHEVRTDPAVVMRTIKSCLRRIKDSSEVYVRVCPEEIDYVKSQRDELMGLADGARDIRISDDRRVTPGGCVVESSSGDLDARIETQLDKLNAKLTETMENDRLAS